MQNVAPKASLARRSRNVLIGALVVALLAILALSVGGFMYGVALVVPSNPSFPTYDGVRRALVVLAGALGLVALGLAVRALTWKTDNALAESVGHALSVFLDKRYVFIRNVSKRQLGYIDAVLVGPAGVLVFRITPKQGNYYNEGTKWMVQRDKGAWKTLEWSPSDEAIEDIKKVRAYLTEKGIDKPQVFGVVVFTNPAPQTVITASNATVPVAQLDTLEDRLLGNYLAKRDRHDLATVAEIAKLLFE
jgi:hypothetical protein